MSKLARRLGTFDAALIVMGGIIGSGIFMTPSVVAAAARTTPLILAAWCFGGVIALAGGFIFAELAWRRCDVRGMYGYIRDAFHPVLAFMSGWTGLLVTQTGGMALSAVTFAVYFTPLTGLHVPPAYVAVAAIVVLNAINALGVREGGTTQNVLMLLKAAAIIGIIAAGFSGAHGPAHAAPIPPAGLGIAAALGAALLSVLFSYDGWQTAAYLDGELKDPRKSLPKALVFGVVGIIALYLLITVAALHELGPAGLAASATPASDMMRLVAGPLGARLVAAAISISTLGFLSNSVLTSPRIYYAMADDGLFFKQFAWLHPKTRVPVYGLILQCIVTIAITLSGRYDQILSYVVSMDFFFLAISGIALLIFRRRDAGRATEGIIVPADPWVTYAFIAIGFAVVVQSFYSSPRETATGFAILLSGVPVYFFWARRSAAAPAVPNNSSA
jgi:APA family basic amino acid/polyamine antiporter